MSSSVGGSCKEIAERLVRAHATGCDLPEAITGAAVRLHRMQRVADDVAEATAWLEAQGVTFEDSTVKTLLAMCKEKGA